MEIWKDIEGYEGLYQISNLGRIKRLSYIQNHPYRIGHTMIFKDKILKPSYDKDGYLLIGLTKSKNRKTYKVHRLVAESFLKNIKSKPTVNHKNSIRDDNRIENLEWATHSEQNWHSYWKGNNKKSIMNLPWYKNKTK